MILTTAAAEVLLLAAYDHLDLRLAGDTEARMANAARFATATRVAAAMAGDTSRPALDGLRLLLLDYTAEQVAAGADGDTFATLAAPLIVSMAARDLP